MLHPARCICRRAQKLTRVKSDVRKAPLPKCRRFPASFLTVETGARDQIILKLLPRDRFEFFQTRFIPVEVIANRIASHDPGPQSFDDSG